MKKRTIESFLLLVFVVISAVSSKGNAVEIETRAGLNVSGFLKTSGTQAKVGAHVGALVGFRICDWFYIQPGVVLDGKGTVLKMYQGYNTSVTGYWLDIPLHASFRVPISDSGIRLCLNVGGYYGVGLFGKTTLKKAGVSASINTFGEYDVNGRPHEIMTRQDLGLSFGIGAEYRQLYFGLGYQQGLVDLLENSGSKNIVGSLSLGYRFNL